MATATVPRSRLEPAHSVALSDAQRELLPHIVRVMLAAFLSEQAQ